MIPGSWWDNTTPAQRREKHEGIAVEYEKEHTFYIRVFEAIRFQVMADVDEDANHPCKPKTVVTGVHSSVQKTLP